jgi:hypothetical protein
LNDYRLSKVRSIFKSFNRDRVGRSIHGSPTVTYYRNPL